MVHIHEINKTLKLLLVGLTAQMVYWGMLVIIWSSIANAASINIRGRELRNLINIEPIPCNPGTNGTSCICPNIECLEYSEKIHGCHPIDCWKWNKIKTQCEEVGKPYISAVVLQAIPFTGYLGSGFGNMGRWDIFGTYWLVIGCGCLCSCMGAGACCISGTEDKREERCMIGCNFGICLLSISMTIMWVWGIVVIANKEVDAPWSGWEGNKIMCPLI